MKRAIVATLALGAALAAAQEAGAQPAPGIHVTEDGTTSVWSGSCLPVMGIYCGRQRSPDAVANIVVENATSAEMHLASWIVGPSFYVSTMVDGARLRPGESRTVAANDSTSGRFVITQWCQSGFGRPRLLFLNTGEPNPVCMD